MTFICFLAGAAKRQDIVLIDVCPHRFGIPLPDGYGKPRIAGAKMVNAVANSVVPKFTVIAGNSFGAGNYAMCGKAYDPRFIVAWPTAQIAVMGGRQASETLLRIRLQAAERGGAAFSPAEQQQLLGEIQERYSTELDPVFAASRLWVDAIIDPARTRAMLSHGIRMAAHNPDLPRFSPGVLQT